MAPRLVLVRAVLAGMMAMAAAEPAEAQTPASKQAKIERILILTNADATMEQSFNAMKQLFAGQMDSSKLPAEARGRAAAMRDRLMSFIQSKMSLDTMKPRLTKLYDETYTDEELTGILAFYESQAGRAFLEKMPTLMEKTMRMTQDLLQELQPEIQKLVMEEISKIPPTR